MTDKAEETRAEVIEPPAVLSGAERWLAEQRGRVEGIAREYEPHEIASAQDYRDSKRARAAARKEIKRVEDDRRRQVGAIKEAVRGFEAQVRDLLAPLSGIDAEYKAEIEAWERLVVDSRTQEVEAWYASQGGVVVDAVPFSRILATYGEEGKWLSYSTNIEAIKEDLTRRVLAIEANLRSIDAQGLDEAERAALKQDYLSTLDVGEAMRRSAERARQREALEADARRREEAERAERERAEAASPAAATGARERTGGPIDTGSVVSPEELARLTGRPPAASMPTGTVAPATHAFCGYCSEEQAVELRDFCRRAGISRVKTFRTGGREYVLAERRRQ